MSIEDAIMELEAIIANAQRLEAAEDYDAAEAAYREAEKLAPTDPRIHNGLGVISMRRDSDPLMALCWYARAIVNDPLNRDTWNNLAVATYEMGQFHLALAHARVALKLDAENTDMIALIADSLDELGACGLARYWWDKLIASKKQKDPGWVQYAQWRLEHSPAERTAAEIRAALLSPRGHN